MYVNDTRLLDLQILPLNLGRPGSSLLAARDVSESFRAELARGCHHHLWNSRTYPPVIQQHVTKSFGFLKTTAIGGLIFLLPLIVVGALVGQVVPIVMSVAEALGDVLPADLKSAGGIALLVLLAIGVILLLCFVAGLLARRSFVKQLAEFFEKKLLLLFPRYAIIREQMAGTLGGNDAESRLKPVFVRFDDMSRLAFETERTENGLVAVYLPGSPDPWSGYVVHVAAERVDVLDVEFPEAVQVVEQLGRGSDKLLEKLATNSEAVSAEEADLAVTDQK